MSDNKCKACGQFSGPGHQCPARVVPTAADTSAALRASAITSNGTPRDLSDRVTRARRTVESRNVVASQYSSRGYVAETADNPIDEDVDKIRRDLTSRNPFKRRQARERLARLQEHLRKELSTSRELDLAQSEAFDRIANNEDLQKFRAQVKRNEEEFNALAAEVNARIPADWTPTQPAWGNRDLEWDGNVEYGALHVRRPSIPPEKVAESGDAVARAKSYLAEHRTLEDAELDRQLRAMDDRNVNYRDRGFQRHRGSPVNGRYYGEILQDWHRLP